MNITSSVNKITFNMINISLFRPLLELVVLQEVLLTDSSSGSLSSVMRPLLILQWRKQTSLLSWILLALISLSTMALSKSQSTLSMKSCSSSSITTCLWLNKKSMYPVLKTCKSSILVYFDGLVSNVSSNRVRKTHFSSWFRKC